MLLSDLSLLVILPPQETLIYDPSPFIDEGDTIDFDTAKEIPAHFTHWRYPIPGSYAVSPPEKPNTLRLRPSRLNLTALDGNYAGPEGQTFVGRRQQDTLFTFSIDINFSSDYSEAEAGVSAFLTQNHHLDLGVVVLPAASSTGVFPGDTGNSYGESDSTLIPQLRFRGISSASVPVPELVIPVPKTWREKTLRLEIRADNATHYVFSAGPADAMSQVQTLVEASNQHVSWGFTGEMFPLRIVLRLFPFIT